MGRLTCCFVNATESNPEPGHRFQCSSIRPRGPNVLQLLSGLELLSTAAAANVNRRAALARPLQTVTGNRQVDVRIPCRSIPGADRADTPSGTFALDRPKRTSGTMALGPPAADADTPTLRRPALGSIGCPGPHERFGCCERLLLADSGPRRRNGSRSLHMCRLARLRFGSALGFSLRIHVEQSRLNVRVPMAVGDKRMGRFEFTERLSRSRPPDPVRLPDQESELDQPLLHPCGVLDSQEIERCPSLAAVAPDACVPWVGVPDGS